MCKRALAIVTLVICASGALAQSNPGSALQGIDRNDLCVTNGNLSVLSGGWLAIDTPSSRAVVRTDAKPSADQVAEIRESNRRHASVTIQGVAGYGLEYAHRVRGKYPEDRGERWR